FDARIAEDALLRFSGVPVVVDLLVRAAGHAHAPPPALLLVDEDDAVLLALVDRARRARGDAGRIEAVLAQARQEHQEAVLELAVDRLLDILEVVVLRSLAKLGAEALLPVGAPAYLFHALAGDDGDGARRRRRLALGHAVDVGVFVVERLVVVVDLRKFGVGE